MGTHVNENTLTVQGVSKGTTPRAFNGGERICPHVGGNCYLHCTEGKMRHVRIEVYPEFARSKKEILFGFLSVSLERESTGIQHPPMSNPLRILNLSFGLVLFHASHSQTLCHVCTGASPLYFIDDALSYISPSKTPLLWLYLVSWIAV